MFRWILNFMITSLIFFPDKNFYEKPEDYQLISEDVFFETADGVKLHGWYLKAPAEKGALLFFHGNAGNISHRLFKAKEWVARGFSVFLVDYRSYGKSQGGIRHGDDIIRDAEAAFHWLTEEKKIPLLKIVPYGESLGSHPAIQLAVKHKVAALVLESPYTSFYDLSRVHYPFVPGSLVKDFAFVNTELIGKIQSPLFILHGTEDEICPYPMSEELFRRAPEPKELFSIPGGTHNDLPISAGVDYWRRPTEFVEKFL